MKPPRDCLSWALEAVLQSDSADPHRYGDVVGDQNLLEVIRRKLETVNKLTGQEIMVTAGANQLCSCAVLFPSWPTATRSSNQIR
mmetsp:Transcript_31292/g.120772  ORF Transcript_31292/g.120772 Transcript_31292/m.120772 type:complete len:85 (+) Transcript_31292:569-823(+)